MGDEPMNAPNIDVAHTLEANEQHQAVVEPVMQRETTNTSTIHQVTPQTSTQP
jgi:hypothetical protein